MKVALGSDHGGFEIKETVKAWLRQQGHVCEDVGPDRREAVDYPDYAAGVAGKVAAGEADFGVLACTTGLGMAMAANKFPGVRAALCSSPELAQKARTHNNANVLVLAGAYTTAAEAQSIVEAWLGSGFADEERHARRVAKIESCGAAAVAAQSSALRRQDPALFEAIAREAERQQTTINLIASENYVSRAVREAQGSILTNKYAEGYPGRRWYGGCENADAIEHLAIERARALFAAEHANVQPHCGSAANMAVYFAMLQPGDTVLAMSLAHGGHLTHGSPVSFSGRFFRFVGYGVRRADERIDYDEVDRMAQECRPRLIVAGASSYPREIDFERFRAIADRAGAWLMVDMAHVAGLVAANCHPSPVPFADFVTSTTHKTLRGARGGLILCRAEHARAIDHQVFPGLQGGPLVHALAGKAVTFAEAQRPEFREYGSQVVRNAQAMAEVFTARGLPMVSGGTDNHMILLNLSALDKTGRVAAEQLEAAALVVNKNALPFDARSLRETSGVRLGTPAMTARGLREEQARAVAEAIVRVVRHGDDPHTLRETRAEMESLARQFPVP